MSPAEMREIAIGGGPAEREIDGVIEIGVSNWEPAAGKPAVLISRPEDSFELFARAITVGCDHMPGNWVREYSVPSFGAAREPPSRFGIDRADPCERCWLLSCAEQR